MKDRATLESNLFQHYAERLYTSPKSSDDKKANGVLAHLSALRKSAREQQGHTSLWAAQAIAPTKRFDRAKANALQHKARSASTRFAEFDHDGNERLDFEEFYAMFPRRVRESHSADEIRNWFAAADADHSGELSINEFFVWTLSGAAAQHGANSLRAICEKYVWAGPNPTPRAAP